MNRSRSLQRAFDLFRLDSALGSRTMVSIGAASPEGEETMKKPTPNLPTAVTDDMIKEIVVGAMRDLITQHRLSFDEAGSALASLVCAPAEVS